MVKKGVKNMVKNYVEFQKVANIFEILNSFTVYIIHRRCL